MEKKTDLELITPNRPLSWTDVIFAIQEVLAGVPDVYLVGGTVRDVYRDHPFKDVDLACPKDGQRIARRLANALGGAFYPLDAERGVGRALITFHNTPYIIDVAAWRGADLLADLQDRDFTLNAMAVPLASDLSAIYDPLNGIADWNARVLRRCSPQSIANDPVRALRAVRQSLALGLTIEPQTRADMRRFGGNIVQTSPERVRDEFMALLGGKKPVGGLQVLQALGLLRLIVPEVEQLSPEAWRYLLAMVDKLDVLLKVIGKERDDNIGANAEFGTYVYLLDRFRGWLNAHLAQGFPNERNYRMLLILALLLGHTHPQARAKALKLSSDEINLIEGALAHAHLPAELHQQHPLDTRTIYRYWRQTRTHGINAILLAISDYLAANSLTLNSAAWTVFLQTLAALLDGYGMAMELEPLVNGDELMAAFDLPPGKHIGELLEALREAQALGEIVTKAEALSLAERLL